MQLACPSCHTAFRVDPPALGGEGRHVRCARCRTTWFARLADLLPEPEGSELAMEAMAPAGAETVGAEASGGGDAAPAVVLPNVVPMNDTVMVEVNPSPPLAPAEPSTEATAPAPGVTHAPLAKPKAARAKKRNSAAQRQMVALGALVAALAFAVVGSRASLVRAMPDLAGFYAAIGMPVNLRGIEFSGVRTTQEMQDGISVLVIEGEVVNVTRQPVEVPRLRFAILGPDQRELYSWTALLQRSMLPEGEALAFRSRLASPPAEGKQVMVRFLNRVDLTANGR